MEISGKGKIILILIAAALVFGGGFKLAQVNNNQQEIPSLIKSEQKEEQSKDVEVVETETEVNIEKENENGGRPQKEGSIFVHVAGAVARPGLYELPQDCRVNDAIKKAEPLPEADLNSLNLAEKLADGQKVQVMITGSTQDNGSAGAVQQGEGGVGTSTNGGKVNINTAGKEQFDALPGIGPSLAQRIIDYRQTHGFFKSVTELGQVSGIGEKKFAEIKAYISN